MAALDEVGCVAAIADDRYCVDAWTALEFILLVMLNGAGNAAANNQKLLAELARRC